jgi:hypothetical protein
MPPARKGARAVEWTGLENRQGRKPLVGSNPTPSARINKLHTIRTPSVTRQLHV